MNKKKLLSLLLIGLIPTLSSCEISKEKFAEFYNSTVQEAIKGIDYSSIYVSVYDSSFICSLNNKNLSLINERFASNTLKENFKEDEYLESYFENVTKDSEHPSRNETISETILYSFREYTDSYYFYDFRDYFTEIEPAKCLKEERHFSSSYFSFEYTSQGDISYQSTKGQRSTLSTYFIFDKDNNYLGSTIVQEVSVSSTLLEASYLYSADSSYERNSSSSDDSYYLSITTINKLNEEPLTFFNVSSSTTTYLKREFYDTSTYKYLDGSTYETTQYFYSIYEDKFEDITVAPSEYKRTYTYNVEAEYYEETSEEEIFNDPFVTSKEIEQSHFSAFLLSYQDTLSTFKADLVSSSVEQKIKDYVSLFYVTEEELNHKDSFFSSTFSFIALYNDTLGKRISFNKNTGLPDQLIYLDSSGEITTSIKMSFNGTYYFI